MKPKRIILLLSILVASYFIYKFAKKYNFNSNYEVGQPIDSLNGVVVYFNGGIDNTSGRNLSADNYNIGIKYQCVEFVKRYYYEHLNHKMSDTYGNAKDFFDQELADSTLNTKRNLVQFTNGSKTQPHPDDLIIMSGSFFNPYGHVAIISVVTQNEIEIIQQNPGPFGKSRETFPLKKLNDLWYIENDRILGWLRKQ